MLDLMLCVDSSNMHLAALMGIPLLSIGVAPILSCFGPLGKGDESILQLVDNLTLQNPLGFGREKCYRGDFACLLFTPKDVVARMEQILYIKSKKI